MLKNITLLQSIEIRASAEKVFDYISNLSNDPLWRPEVTKMDVQGELRSGTVIIEYITIYKFFHIVTPTVVKVLDRPNKFVVETPPGHPTWVECIRTVSNTAPGDSIFTVQLSFSLNNLKQIFPIIPPALFVNMWYKPRMRGYMNNLKKILESTLK